MSLLKLCIFSFILFNISLRTLTILIIFGLNFLSDNSIISSIPNLVLALDLCLLILFLKPSRISYIFCWKLDKMYWEKETEVNRPWVWVLGLSYWVLSLFTVFSSCRCQRLKFPLVSLLFSLLSSLGFSRHLLNKVWNMQKETAIFFHCSHPFLNRNPNDNTGKL